MIRNEFSTYMLMESMSGDSAANHKAGSFYLPDAAGQKQPSEHFHRDFVDCCQIDPSGMYYVTSAKDGTIRLWAQGSVQLVKTIRLGQTWVLAMALLPFSGRIAVSTDDRKIKFYDIHTWEVVMDVELQNPALCLGSWKHADAEMFAYGNHVGEITIVNMSKGLKTQKQLEKSADKKQVRRPKVWAESRTRIVHNGWVNQITKVDDLGCVVSCGGDSNIAIFEVPFRANPDVGKKEHVVTKRILRHHRGHVKGVKCFEWVQSFKLIVSGGLERELIVWNPYTGKPVLTLSGHTAGIEMLQLHEEHEQLISLSTDKVLKVWDMRQNECVQTMTEFKHPLMKPTSFLIDKSRNRVVSFGHRHQVFKINPLVDVNTVMEDTHHAPVIAILYNTSFGNVVTVAENSECSVWRPVTGEQIFTFFDTERNDETHITCANFDEAGRRLMTGDHHGVVRVWNFNNGACIKTLVKPRDRQNRQELTSICSYIFEDKRFIAASSWDRKVTVWMDFSEDSGTVTPVMQMQGQNTDVLSIGFTYPKSLAAACADGTIGIFDVESGHKKMTMLSERTRTGQTPRNPSTVMGTGQFVERIVFLEQKNSTLVSAGADGSLRFWEGQWMPHVPSHCNTSVMPCRNACLIAGNHPDGAAVVDVKSDDENKYLVTADEAGFIKTWDISQYDWRNPHPDQVEPISLWQAHQVGVNIVDIMVPSNTEDGVENEVPPLVFSCAADRCAMLWTLDGAHVGKFGQSFAGRSLPWDLYDTSTWKSELSLDILSHQPSNLQSPVSQHDDDSGDSSDEEDFNAVLNELDDRLRAQAPVKSQTKSDCFEDDEEWKSRTNGLPVASLSQVPDEKKGQDKKKVKDYVVDEITGERIYKSGFKKAAVGDEKKRPTRPFVKNFTKTLSGIFKTPRGDAQEDPKDAENKIVYATASTLMKIFDVRCEGQGWKEPDASQKDVLCTKIRHALEVRRDLDEGVDKIVQYFCNLRGATWDEMLSQADMESL